MGMKDVRLVFTFGGKEVGEERGDDDEDETDDYTCSGETNGLAYGPRNPENGRIGEIPIRHDCLRRALE